MRNRPATDLQSVRTKPSPSRIARNLFLFLFVFASGASSAAASDVPRELEPWVPWAMHGLEPLLCPSDWNAPESRHCAWPGPLEVSVSTSGGQFSHSWRTYAEEWVGLPGGERQWPQEVSANGRRVPVVPRNGVPSVRLPAGEHVLTGAFAWGALPETLLVPKEVGLVRLSVAGSPVPRPFRDEEGRLWLQPRDAGHAQTSATELQVFRKISDGVPLLLETRIQVNASGPPREVVLGRPVLQGFAPHALRSAIPARLDPDGTLRAQVRPGAWTLTIEAHSSGPMDRIAAPTSAAPWPATEVWSFQAENHVRLVEPAGAPRVDPEQTALPVEWRALPAFRMERGGALVFKVIRRGDPIPEPDRLTIRKTLWLDFDGRGYTVHDAVSGVVTRTWRLETAPGVALGSASVNGEDRFITKTDAKAGFGVEVRQGSLELATDSRIEARPNRLSAVGWAFDVEKAAATLHLPPGWGLLAALGVDNQPDTWLQRWNLLDLFLVLVISLAGAKLFGRWTGALFVAALGLTWHTNGAPQYLWLHVLVGAALTRFLQAERWQSWARGYLYGTLLLTALLCLGLAVQEARLALYPQLEYAARSFRPTLPPLAAQKPVAPGPVPSAAPARDLSAHYDPRANVQTGPGLPAWTWNRVDLQWNGPVRRDQTVTLLYLPPLATRTLRILKIAGLAALLWRLFRTVPPPPRALGLARSSAAAAFLLAVCLWPGRPAHAEAASFPPKELLDQIPARLAEPKACAANCAAVPRLHVDAHGDVLRLRCELHAGAAVSAPLPGGSGQWMPEIVRIVGKQPARVTRRDDGTLWADFTAGVHELLLEGTLRPETSNITIPLPLRPQRVTVSAPGWSVEGVREDLTSESEIRLSRTLAEKGIGDGTHRPTALPPLLRLERTFLLGLDWRIHNRLTRLSPAGVGALLQVPLLPGESVTTDGFHATAGFLQVGLGAGESEIEWDSTLAPGPSLSIRAPGTAQWVESWAFDVAPLWHVQQTAGIAPVHHRAPEGRWLPKWQPWPGESLSLSVLRPAGVEGRTLTIETSSLETSPGRQATLDELRFRYRSSQGGQHTVTLPRGAVLDTVEIDAAAQPVRQEGQRVPLPITPGSHDVKLKWKTDESAGLLTRTSKVDLGSPSVNHSLSVSMPRNRWVLAAFGPRLGPAVLFWAVVLVLLVVSFGLTKVPFVREPWTTWFLLGIGLTQSSLWAFALIVAWFVLIGLRGRKVPSPRYHRLVQGGLILLTLVAAGQLLDAVRQGLLGNPEMQIVGNGSSFGELRWYADRLRSVPPQALVFSLPMAVYRGLMLSWALWLAASVLRWARWAWTSFNEGGIWPGPRTGPGLFRLRRAAPQGAPGPASSPTPARPSGACFRCER
ncbi:MAG: hypothetical protein HY900_19430 [Deltaproteobacteria bacterium]|nr:hypothetical protein [Deltaproteobacteria bacterium]